MSSYHSDGFHYWYVTGYDSDMYARPLCSLSPGLRGNKGHLPKRLNTIPLPHLNLALHSPASSSMTTFSVPSSRECAQAMWVRVRA